MTRRRAHGPPTLTVLSQDPATGDKLRFTAPGRVGYADVSVGTPEQIRAHVEREFDGHEDAITDHVTTSDWTAPVAYLDWIVTNENKRGRGHAERLLEHVLAYLDSEGVVATYALSAPGEDEDPDRLIQWYFRHGFSVLEGTTEISDATPILRTA